MKANFIIIKMLVYIRVIVETATGYTIENIKGSGEKEEGGMQMTIQEAKNKANKEDEVQKTLLDYIDYLENRIKDLLNISKAHQEQAGGLIEELKSR